MRTHRDTMIVWTITLVLVLALMVGLLVVFTPTASSHRVVNGDWAQNAANGYLLDHYCGGDGWTCTSVSAPVTRCGFHSYCWWGVSYRECVRVPFWGCIWRRSRSSSGTVNGHTGHVTGYGSW